MSLKQIRIGVAITGSHCTYAQVFPAIKMLIQEGAHIQTIFSYSASSTDTRFGAAQDFLAQAQELTHTPPICTISEAEPIGPQKLLDLLILLPCTGNTLAKLANGITDTPVLMAAKAHLRNNRPLLIFLSTNDALGMNLKNIGILMNTKHIYFVPFNQDHPEQKPNSMISHIDLLLPSIHSALNGQQYQPILC